MAKNFVKNGQMLTVVLAVAVTSGELLIVGDVAGVAVNAGAIGDSVELSMCGVYELNKAVADAPAAGANAYYDESAKEVTTVATGNRLVGVFIEAYANGDTVAAVRLNGGSLPVAGASA